VPRLLAPLYAFIRRQGYGVAEAQDLTQEFFTRLLERKYLGRYDQERGKFRSFLLAFVKHFLSDVGTRQELLTLGGTGSILDAARWSADGYVILVGAPWQAWRAPSREAIAAAEAKEKTEIKQP
jgi:hypothetical protein